MQKPKMPVSEDKRIETLNSLNILDTQNEERFDRLTRMAKGLLGVPITLVSLVDEDRQWFKSKIGLDADETPRDISFCGHAILGDEVFVINNAQEDARFSDNPLVTNNPNIRFYAGCPLSAANGEKMGTLCVIDNEPRELDSEDIQALKDLASMVEKEMNATKMATMDELTDISNKRGFTMLGQQSLDFSKRQKLPATLVFLDLDKFKPINDTFGHAEGDLALKTFANHLKEIFRNSDTFGRLGGDEFAVLLSNTTKDLANDIVTKLHMSLELYNQDSNRGYKIEFSHGVIEFNSEKHKSIEDLLAAGDDLMYELKRSKS